MAYTDIDKPSDYFNTVLYTGNGSTQSITGVGFQPDWVWCKARSYTDSHFVFDVVRGVTKHLQTNSTSAEVTNANSLTAFGSDGFTLGSDGGANSNGDTYASWNWLGANGTSANTDGSISSTVSSNTTSGFSIVSYTGTGANATVGHGLNSEVKFIIIKNRDAADSWITGHSAIGFTKFTKLDENGASGTSSGFFNDTAPTSSVFSIGNQDDVNASGEDLIAYCFAEKKGFSKFGSYVGNGNADGTFVYTGFKPAMVILKSSTSAADWELSDNKRTTSGGNVIDKEVRPNTSGAETGGTDGRYIDYLSNGFKLRQGFGNWNGSGETYIYMAFAENPLVGTNNIPATAR